MKRGLYRKLHKNICCHCDHPVWCPSKNVNPKRACIQCRKWRTKRGKIKI